MQRLVQSPAALQLRSSLQRHGVHRLLGSLPVGYALKVGVDRCKKPEEQAVLNMKTASHLAIAAALLRPGLAVADGPNDSTEPVAIRKDVKSEIPNVAFAYTAHGVSVGTVGVQAYGLVVATTGSGQQSFLGGGGAVWASPIDRLTLIADGSRDFSGNFAPSLAGVVRILGTPGDGFTLGVLGKFKVEGFGTGPDGETESEIESGLLLSYARYGWHGDLNAVVGFGTGDDGEIDGEARLRLAHDLGNLVRVGLDSQARYRVAGTKSLPGGRSGDFVGGPQLLVGTSHFYGSVTAGLATMGVESGIGWTSIVSIGGVTL